MTKPPNLRDSAESRQLAAELRQLAESGVSRRGFLLGLGAVAGLTALGLPLGLRHCARTTTSEIGPYAVWREVQQALRASPDHTPGRAAALVAAGDARALHRLVRDEIRLVSAEGARFALGAAMPWGTRVALRAGAGSAREKAELLAELMRDCGYTAEVVDSPGLPRDQTAATFFRSFDSAFTPPIEAAQLADWRRRLALPDMSTTKALQIDPDASQADALSKQVLSSLGATAESIGRNRYDDRSVGATPVVKFTAPDGSEGLADPIRADGGFGPVPEGLRLKPAAKAGEAMPVSVRLSARFSDAPKDEVELVSGQWSADQLAGRQLRIGFRPSVDIAQWAVSRFADLRCFVPVLGVQAVDLDAQQAAELGVIGDAFSIDGQRYSVAEDGAVSVDGRPLQAPGAMRDAATVVQLQLDVDSSRFPELRLKLNALDAAGKLVEGLPAQAFAVSEQDRPVGFGLSSNRAAPRVLFLADSSLSMPETFRGGRSQMDALIARVTERVRDIHPDAEVIARTTGSRLWDELARAAMQPYSLIVYATDGDLDGRRPDAPMLEALRQGPPALILDVNGELLALRERGAANIFDQMAEATGGEAFAVEEGRSESAEQAILRRLRDFAVDDPYRLACTASGLESGERRVRVQVGNAQAEAVYQVPESPAAARRLISLSVQISVGGYTAQRLLAGYNGVAELSQRDQDAALGALFGMHVIGFEASPPSLSVLLDDMLAAKLSIEPLDRATADDADLDTLQALLNRGFDYLPGELGTLLARSRALSGSDFSTATQGMRCVLYSSHPVMNSDRLIQRVDILPLERAAVLAVERDTLLRESLRRSADLALAEARLFPVSTLALLQERPLQIIDRRPYRDVPMPDEARAAWAALIEDLRTQYAHPGAAYIAPVDGSVRALWSVDRSTGELLGVLADGSGGGSAEIRLQQQLAELDRVIAGINLLAIAAGSAGAVNPIGGVALGIVAAYGQRLARLYAAASMSIILMDSSGIAPALRLAIAGMACEVTKNITLGVFGSAGRVASRSVEIFASAENLVGVGGGSTPFSCPI